MNAMSTNFLNSKMRRIFKTSAGKYFSKSDAGKKSYGIKATFRKVGANGAVSKISTKSVNNTVPSPVRKKVRMIRGNKGVARGARGPMEGKMQRMMNAQSKRLGASRARAASKKRARNNLMGYANYNPFTVLMGKKR